MWAHSANSKGSRHSLEDHLRGTAVLAGGFAKPFGLGDLGHWAGLAHDAGKAWCDWQQKLLLVEQSGAPVGLDHRSFGVQLARCHGLEPVEWVVAGHHGGLSCRSELERLFGADEQHEERLRSIQWPDVERRLRPVVPELFEQVPALPAVFADTADPLVADFYIRFLFSCLVDADVLDTQAHRWGSVPVLGSDLDASVLFDRFMKRRAEFLSQRRAEPMDPWREQLFDAAVTVADDRRGIFRMTAPTGAAKTIAAAGFALQHARKHELRRVIVAVPFITVTEQNAGVYRQLLDPAGGGIEPVVLEHHSHVEFGDPSDPLNRWRRAATENWSAPFVVTTTVQLFESLFGRKPSRMRKLHRLADSVIVLDEVQALPHRLLPQVADAIRILTEHFGATVVLSSATQPELQRLSPLRNLPSPVEITPDPKTFFAECSRVRYQWRLWPRPTLAQTVTEAVGHAQALVVVNTVKDARTAFAYARREFGDRVAVRHLSTGMCAAHRQAVLDEVKQLLKDDAPLLLISTSLVEAGVDVDFPAVFRAIAPPDAMAQAAGRCNRGKRLGEHGGLVVIFDPVDGGMPPSYKTQIETASKYFGPPETGKADPEDVDELADYFQELYRRLRVEQRGGASETIRLNRIVRDFEAVTDGPFRRGDTTRRDRELAFQMMLDDTIPVIVPYRADPAPQVIADCLRRLTGSSPDMSALRGLQPYLTTIRRATAQRPETARRLTKVAGDLHQWDGEYDDDYGMVLEPGGNGLLP
ncbi:CRISPR-associated endonuclease Cas3'' [Actinoplanes sp. NPDC051851]|uniref:CRISPR-associated endonuclease Cas3'' n=1 Tax=Actinoplanes sp. NPDC051851 TaxID=3154753 RepID=UPI0034322764